MNACIRLFVAAFFLSSSAALAQVRVEVGLPSIRFEVVPPLVVVSPGVQVVEDYDEEVFFVDRYYYVREGGHWYHTRDHRGSWVRVEERYVPVTLVRSPHGKYRHYRRGSEPRTVYVEREQPRRVVYVEEHDHDDHGDHKHKGKGGHGKGHGKH
jgi:hypothetical protein